MSRTKSFGDARLVETFLDMMSAERGASINTLAAYRRDLLDFYGFLAGRGADATRATRDHIKHYLVSLSSSGAAGSSQARRLSALRQFFGFLYAEGIRTAFCWNRDRRNDADTSFRHACAREECDEPDVFALLGYETGRALAAAAQASPAAGRDAGAFRDALAAAAFTSPRGKWTLDPDSGEVNTHDWLMEVRPGEATPPRLEAAERLPLPARFRADYDRYRGQELRPGWINPYLVN